MEEGKYYLFAAPWDWTFIGRFRGIRGVNIIIDHAIYFIRTGARFGQLCHSGLVPESQYSECGNGILIDHVGTKVFPWHAKTPWKNPSEGKK